MASGVASPFNIDPPLLNIDPFPLNTGPGYNVINYGGLGKVNPMSSVCILEINPKSRQHTTSHGPCFVLSMPHGPVM